MSTKRTSKKLLVGLGSTIGFVSTVTIGGFGIKSIIDSTMMQNSEASLYATPKPHTEIDGYNTAKWNMFIDTNGLVPHLGTVSKGQAVTPYGSLGTYRNPSVDVPAGYQPSNYGEDTLALVSWSGTVLWVNDLDNAINGPKIYDVKYESNTDSIFVVRTNSLSGAGIFQDGRHEPIYLDILNARTGQKKCETITLGDIQWEANKSLLANGALPIYSWYKDMYYQDVVYIGNDTVLFTYAPNILQLHNSNRLLGAFQIGDSESFQRVTKTFIIKFGKQSNNSLFYDNAVTDAKEINPLGSGEDKIFDLSNMFFSLMKDVGVTWTDVERWEYAFITQPFLTWSKDAPGNGNNVSEVVLHAIIGKPKVINADWATEPGRNQVHHVKASYKINTDNASNSFGKRVGSAKALNANEISSYVDLGNFWAVREKLGSKTFTNAYTKLTRNIFDQNVVIFPYIHDSPGKFTGEGSSSTFGYKDYMLFGSGEKMDDAVPIWNVSQLVIQSSRNNYYDLYSREQNHKTDKISWNWSYGTDIVNRWKTDQIYKKDPLVSSSTEKALFYPWTFSNNQYGNMHNVNLLYNRVLAISPFNNTLIYSARPKYTFNNGNKDWFTQGYRGSKYSDYLSVYVSNTSSVGLGDYTENANSVNYVINGQYTPDASVEATMINNRDLADLYANPFYMDIKGLSWEGVKNADINLYFNQSGVGKNRYSENAFGDKKGYGLMPTSKIGLVPKTINERENIALTDDQKACVYTSWEISSKAKANIDGRYDMSKEWSRVSLDQESYLTLINSMANLDNVEGMSSWYSSTYQNFLGAGNTYKDSARINGNPTEATRAIATIIGKRLTGGNFDNRSKAKEVVDLYTASAYGKGTVDGKENNNYSRIISKRPDIRIKVKNDPENKANLLLYGKMYMPIDDKHSIFISSDYASNSGGEYDGSKWSIQENGRYKDFGKWVWSKDITIPNTSFKIFSSWSTHAKIASLLINDSNELEITESRPKAVQGNYGQDDIFGSINNDYYFEQTNSPKPSLPYINKSSLRIELGIDVNPFKRFLDSSSQNIDEWVNKIPRQFKETYPLVAGPGEKSFSQIFREFNNWKTQNVFSFVNPNVTGTMGTLGLGSIAIKGYLKLNPNISRSTKQIYKLPDETLVLPDQAKLYLYKDEYRETEGRYNLDQGRYVYAQVSHEFKNNRFWGFSEEARDFLAASLEDSVIGSKNLLIPIDKNLFSDTLVRDTDPNISKILSFDYTDSNKTAIKITMANEKWAKIMDSYTSILGRDVVFQYSDIGSNEWKNFASFTKNKWNFTDNNLSFNFDKFPSKNIRKIRFVLIPISEGDSNQVVKYLGEDQQAVLNDYSRLDEKFISDEFSLKIQPLDVDYNWIKNATFDIGGQIINNISVDQIASYLVDYQNSVLNNIVASHARQYVKIKFSFDNSNKDGYLEANEFARKIYDLTHNWNAPNLGIEPFYSSKSRTGKKIYARFVFDSTIEGADAYKFNELVNGRPESNPLNGENNLVNTDNLKTKIDLSSWIHTLQTEYTIVQGSPSNMTFEPPRLGGNAGSAFLAGKAFDDVVAVLDANKIKIQYQDASGRWISNKPTSYNEDLGTIKFRFSLENENSKPNIAISTDGTNEILTGLSDEFSFKLNIPMKVSINDEVKNNWINSLPVSGNTYHIEVDQRKEETLIEGIINFNNGLPNSHDFSDLKLVVKYRLGNSGDYRARQDFINFLGQQTINQKSNQVDYIIELINEDPSNPKYVLSNPASLWTGTIYQDNNTNVKKYIHGSQIETALDNITVSGSKRNINYGWPQEALDIINGTTKGLGIQYTINSNALASDPNVSSDPKTGWVNGLPPTDVFGKLENANQIWVRVVTTDDSMYVYGPKEDNSIRKHLIDLTQIATLIVVNKEWFKEVNFDTQDHYVSSLKQSDIDVYEDAIWEKFDSAVSEEVKKQIKIVYTFNGKTDLDKNALFRELRRYEEVNKDNPDVTSGLGILRLFTDASNLGEKIQATFAKKDPNNKKIEFVDINGNTNTDLTGDVNTNSMRAFVDLNSYSELIASGVKAVVELGEREGEMKSFTPPAMPAGSGFLNGKTFSQIQSALKKEFGVVFKFDNLIQGGYQETLAKYDVSKTYVHMALFTTSSYLSTSVDLKFNNKVIESKGDTSDVPLKLWLQAPSRISISSEQINNFIASQPISGNTKKITYQENVITDLINNIKNTNATNSGNESFKTAKLKIKFRLGNEGEFREIADFKNFLTNQNSDQTTNLVQFKFVVENNDPKNPDFIVDETEHTLYPNDISDTGVLKIFINKKNLESLANNVSISGSNKNFTWTWPEGLNVDNQSSEIISSPGIGLKVQYTFNKDAGVNDPTGSDVKTGWVDAQPHSYDVGQKDLFIRFVTKSGYVYEAIEDGTYAKHLVDLSKIKEQIEVNKIWLTHPLVDQDVDIKNISVGIFTEYEKAVLANLQSDVARSKVAIRYDFNGRQNLTKEKLVDEIQAMVISYGKPYIGVVQMWNGSQGEQITSKFVKASEQDQSYELIEPSGNFTSIVDSSRIISSIDLRGLVTYLKNTPVRINPGQSDNSIAKLLMPNYPGQIGEGPLAGYDWNTVSERLAQVGVTIEWREVIDVNNPANWGDRSSVTRYNEFNPIFQIRFKIDKFDASNVKLSVINENDVDSINFESSEVTINLKVARKLKINDQLVQAFINNESTISGNTKHILISQENEKTLLDAVVAENVKVNPIFGEAKVFLEYQLGSSGWLKRGEFIDHLKQQTFDQVTNKVDFRFNVENKNPDDPDFAISNNSYELSPEEIGSKTAKIKIFINQGNLEILAGGVSVSGTNTSFVYDWNTLNVDAVTGNVNNINGLRVQYTTKVGMQNQEYVPSTDPTTGWSDVQVDVIDPVERYLAIQLVALDGYVYGAQYDKAWNVHVVNTEPIKSEINVNNNELTNLVVSGNVSLIDLNRLRESEKTVLNTIQDPTLRGKLEIQYNVSFGPQKETWVNAETLSKLMQDYIYDYNNETLSMLKFNANNVNIFNSIKARFNSKDEKYIPLDLTLGSVEETIKGKEIDTTNIVTTIDLQGYVSTLQAIAVKFDEGSSSSSVSGLVPPGQSGVVGEGFLFGKSFDEIATALDKVGIEIQFQAPGSTATQDKWVTKEEIKSLNKQNELFLRFKIKNDALAAKDSYSLILSEQTPEILGSKGETKAVKLVVDLPIVIDVNPQDLEIIKLVGATNGITNVQEAKEKIAAIIDQVKKANSSEHTKVDDANIVVEFSLDENDIDGKGVWFQIDEFNKHLTESKTNWNTNQIKARFNIIPEQAKYQLSTKASHIISPKNTTNDAPIKMYIHSGKFFNNVVNTLLPSGSSDEYEIKNLAKWMKTVPEGLWVQFTSSATPDDISTVWVDAPTLPKPLDSNKNLYIRFAPKSGYIFEGSQDTNNPTAPIKLNTENVKTVIKLEKVWLDLIQLTGNLKELQIDEQQLIEKIKSAGILPSGIDGLVEIQYTHDGRTWLTKDDFVAKLNSLDGALDAENFILKRENIKARFNLNAIVNSNNEYILNINGINITSDTTTEERDKFNAQLITPTLNSSVRGYININKLSGFIFNNFEITGSNSAPIFNVKDSSKISALLQVYASDNIFDILYTTQGSVGPDGKWTPSFADVNKKIWDGTQFIKEVPDIISGDKYFAIKFVAKENSNYDVYENGTLLPEGKILDLTKNVHIRVEIANPFTTANKSIGLWFRNVDNTPKYFQSQGGFKLSVIDNASGINDVHLNAVDFVKNSSLTDSEKNALEFVYIVFDGMPSVDEFASITSDEAINNYDNGKWKVLPENLDPEGFTESLNLKVNQYIAVALRVKKSAADDGKGGGYTLKSDYSILSPIAPTPGESKGRVNGYKVDPSKITINWNSVELLNYVHANKDPLDGFTTIKKLTISKDDLDNYLGVDIFINRFNTYYEGMLNQPIITSTNTKLVKRTPSANWNNEYYKSSDTLDGNIKIDEQGFVLDKTNQKVPIYLNENGNPTPPVKEQNVTGSKQLTALSTTDFFLDANDNELFEWGLFANQDIQFELKGKVGDGTPELPDFYIDKTNNAHLRDENVGDKIKFPLQNPRAIRYEFKQIENVKIVNPIDPSKNPFEGQAQIDPNSDENSIVITRWEGSTQSEVKGIEEIRRTIEQDFGGKLNLKIKFQSIDGGSSFVDTIYDKKNLKNKDRYTFTIEATNSNDIFAEAPTPLIIVINNLAKKSPELEEMQYLRVEQGGKFNGEGSFRVYVNKPGTENIDISIALPGYKFLTRVWNKNKEIKIDWTDNFDNLNNLSNGDKVEWKLVSDNNAELNTSFYNTIALEHKLNPDGSTTYNFAQVNYPNGIGSEKVVKPEVGQTPSDQLAYPEDSGFVIAGLIENPVQLFNITEDGLQKAMIEINPTYYGINGEGSIKIDEKWLTGKFFINTKGEIYEKEAGSTPPEKQQYFSSKTSDQQSHVGILEEVDLISFLQQVTYYKVNPKTNPTSLGFNWSPGDTNISNKLSNGENVWVGFSPMRYENGALASVSETPVVYELPLVYGLTDVSDSMNPLWYLAFAAVGLATLGIFTLIYFIFKNKKLRGK